MALDVRDALVVADADSHAPARAVDVPPLADRTAKRVFDVVFSLVALVLAAPLLLVLVAGVKLTSPGPVFYRALRIGHGGRVFRCYKLRTMVPDAEIRLAEVLETDPDLAEEFGRTQKLRQDPRTTSIGPFLRRTSLDELPQLFNVLRGDMSIVGWRPLALGEPLRYGFNFDVVCQARPGITGLWQTSGRSDLSYEERVELDVAYVRHWSLRRDLRIMVRTVRHLVPLRGNGAY